ncbi:hypothetical protein CAC42_2727 [Sphaceloma murrayae]|uniref:CID domain-containing protein n=1 Tax=Sphaceloma murrayae TaxID=2082308 RepID=A0A2K1R0J6_9PEZI|nr:hypothetical protein CAC42_2727 [Sphaceloma murrayae]
MDNSDDSKGIEKFANVADKLNAPKKISQFEKARQEAEQKRLREEAEAAAALRDFEDSFAGEDEEPQHHGFRPPPGPGQGRPSFRQEQEDDSEDDFVNAVTGRAPRGPTRSDTREIPNSRWPRDEASRGSQGRAAFPSGPPSLKRKRELEEMAARRRGSDERGHSDSPKPGAGQRDVRSQLSAAGDEDRFGRSRTERRRTPEENPSVRRPTMLLQSLPRSMTESAVRKIMPTSLKVEEINFINPKSRGEDRTRSALVITSAATPISEINTIVSQMQHQYLGFGCYLNITRHVSASGNASSVDTSTLSMTSKHPFGATQAQSQEPLSFEPQRSSFNRAAPPNSFERNASSHRTQGQGSAHVPGGLQVTVTPPSDIKLLKLIHTTAERLMTYGPDFEMLLMSRASVQHDEKWAWLFDSTSKAGIYYRWLIWHWLSTPSTTSDAPIRVFSSGPPWVPPPSMPKFQSALSIHDLASHEDYNSSEDESGDETGPAKSSAGGKLLTIEEAGGDNAFDGQSHYLNPYRRAKLTHLLHRLPDNMAVLRVGDIARVTDFVVRNAGRGAEEIVDMLLCNVEVPFCHCVDYDEGGKRQNTTSAIGSQDGATNNDASHEKKDMSGGQLVALYVISDVLLSSSTSGVRDAWKYRALFETAMKERGIFERLGRLDREHAWGRMKGEQWKRKINVILDLWYSANVFTSDGQKHFKRVFMDPPLSKEEMRSKAEEERAEHEAQEKGKWKSANDAPKSTETEPTELRNAKVEPTVDAKDEALRKIAAMKARMAGGDGAVGSPATDVAKSDSATPQPAPPGKRVRPTAADLIDAPEEPEPAPAQQTMPAMGAGGFGFSLSLGGGNAPKATPRKEHAPSSAPVAGFAIGVKETPTDKPSATSAGNMFADSDED